MRTLFLTLLFALLPTFSLAADAASPTPDELVAAVEAAEKGDPANLDEAVGRLGGYRFAVDSALVKVQLVTFDELAGKVILRLESTDPAVPLQGQYRLETKLALSPTLLWSELRAAARDSKWSAQVVYRLARPAPGIYVTQVHQVTINGRPAKPEAPLPALRWNFAAGQRSRPKKAAIVDAKAVPASSSVAGFLMSVVPITQDQYQAVTGTNPSRENEPAWAWNHPVQDVSWRDAVAFANHLSRLDGLDPVYTLTENAVSIDASRNGWRLPTAAEWDWARQGSATSDDVAWVRNPKSRTMLDARSVATKKPNALGLYDLTGNVFEWVGSPSIVDDASSVGYVGASFLWEASEFTTGDAPQRDAIRSHFRDRGFRLLRSLPGSKSSAQAPVQATALQLIDAYEAADPDSPTRQSLLAPLLTSRWNIDPTAFQVTLSAFDRTLKQWTATIQSNDPQAPGKVQVGLSIKGSLDLPASYRAVVAAQATSSLGARISWGLSRRNDGRYQGRVSTIDFGQMNGKDFLVLQTVRPVIEWEFSPQEPQKRTLVPALTDVAVAGGTFTQGGTRLMGESLMRSDNSQHMESEVERVVTLSDFRMMTTPVTQDLYTRVMGRNPSAYAAPDSATHPVESVTWFDAVEFANRLSLAMDLEPAYDIGPRSDLSASTTELQEVPAVTVHPERSGWRLPSSAEYVWALRGGKGGKNLPYPGSSNFDEIGWSRTTTGGITQPVAQKKPNELGLYDLLGNVSEWMGDYFATTLPYPVTDPMGPARASEEPYLRDVRGGSVFDTQFDTQFRSGRKPNSSMAALGFRLVRRGGPVPGATWAGPFVNVTPVGHPSISIDPRQAYRLVNVGQGDSLSLGVSQLSSSDAVFYSDLSDPSLTFHFVPVSGGYQIVNDSLGRATNFVHVDIVPSRVRIGEDDGSGFAWSVEPVSNTTFRLVHLLYGVKVAIEAQISENGSDLIVNAKNGSPQQLWKLVPVNAGE